MTAQNTDRIEKNILIKASRSKVWDALTDSRKFGQWFQVKLSEPFVPGKEVTGQFTIQGYEHVSFFAVIDRIEPETHFSYRWHPYSVKPEIDYTKEESTLVVFTLSETKDGTLLKVVESGFDKIPAERRDEALRMNTNGWEAQLKNIERYVGQSS